jgi:beta-galactosidase
VVASNDYVAGQFLWTGIDFLGEANRYPVRGSSSGLLDLCGFRKPEAYLREALWSDRPMVYAAAQEAQGGPGRPRLAEHWNWAGDARQTIPVEVYTNCDAAELFLNGKSLGERAVTDRARPVLRWDVPNEAGTVRAIGKRQGREAARFELATVGAPDHLALAATAGDVASIEIRVEDAAGHRVVAAKEPVEIRVEATGGELVAVDSGDQRDMSAVQTDRRRAYQGRILALVRPLPDAKSITVRASAAGVRAGEVQVAVR